MVLGEDRRICPVAPQYFPPECVVTFDVPVMYVAIQSVCLCVLRRVTGFARASVEVLLHTVPFRRHNRLLKTCP